MPGTISFSAIQEMSIPEAMRALVTDEVSIIPVNPADKKPWTRWKTYQSSVPTSAEIESWIQRFGARLAIGLVTGQINDWVVIDADSPEAQTWVERTKPKSAMLPVFFGDKRRRLLNEAFR